MKTTTHRTILLFLLTFSLMEYSLYAEELRIPEASIAPLQMDFDELKVSRESVSRRRRGYKNVIRTGQALIKTQPKASNRFKVLALILGAQQKLLELEKTQRNRDAFYETCEMLAQAPDEYSGYRLNAELLLSDRDLSAKDANAQERIKALEAMVARNRDKPDELECLIRVINIASKLGAYELKGRLMKSLSERFAGDTTAIAFRRKTLASGTITVVFSGAFERLDGSSIVFPHDRLGHLYYVVFWSKESPLAIEKLKRLREEQKKLPNVVELYSLNVDELPDSGKEILNSIGLECTILQLPGGKTSETYLTYAQDHPWVLRVNQLGYTVITPVIQIREENNRKPGTKLHEGEVDTFAFPLNDQYSVGINEFDRYSAQLRYLFNGDFLVPTDDRLSADNKDGVDLPIVKAIHACFVSPPLRYQLTTDQELENYKKANELSSQAIGESNSGPGSWRLQNYKIIALMGMANLSGSADYLDQAVKESRKLLKLALPKGADIPARFCLTMSALRNRDLTPKFLIDGFIEDCGGEDASASAYAAACILAMADNSPELYNKYRIKTLKSKDHSSSLDPIMSFLKDRYHQYYLFKDSAIFRPYIRPYRIAEQNYVVDHSMTPMKDPLPKFELKTLDGKVLSMPNTDVDALTILVFVQPPVEGQEFPPQLWHPPDKPTKKRPDPQPGGLLSDITAMKNAHANKGVRVIAVFLSHDVERVKAIQEKFGLSETVTVLPGGLSNPIVNRLGIISADRFANVMLIRRDGSIAWRKNGLFYQKIGKDRHGHVVGAALRHQITTCDAEAGYRALKAKDYKRALKMFAGNLGEVGKWRSTLAHGRALAHLAMKNYEGAMKEIDAAIAMHSEGPKRKYSNPNLFLHDGNKPCSSMIHMLTTKGKILDHLGRKAEARTARNKATVKPTDYPTDYYRVLGFNRPYEAFEDKMSIIAKEIK